MSEETPNQSSDVQSFDWRGSIDESLRSDPAVQKYNNINDLVKDHVNAQGLLGRKGLIIPKDGDDASVYDSFREGLGVPKDATGYSLDGVTVPEGLTADEDIIQRMAKVAHETNIPAAAFAKLVQEQLNISKEINDVLSQAGSEAREQAEQQLRKDWGAAYTAKMETGDMALTALIGDNDAIFKEMQLADGSKLIENPAFRRLLAKMGENLEEKGLIGDKRPNMSTKTPEDSLAEITQLQADPVFMGALYDSSNPGHDAAVQKWERAHMLAFPEPT